MYNNAMNGGGFVYCKTLTNSSMLLQRGYCEKRHTAGCDTDNGEANSQKEQNISIARAKEPITHNLPLNRVKYIIYLDDPSYPTQLKGVLLRYRIGVIHLCCKVPGKQLFRRHLMMFGCCPSYGMYKNIGGHDGKGVKSLSSELCDA